MAQAMTSAASALHELLCRRARRTLLTVGITQMAARTKLSQARAQAHRCVESFATPPTRIDQKRIAVAATYVQEVVARRRELGENRAKCVRRRTDKTGLLFSEARPACHPPVRSLTARLSSFRPLFERHVSRKFPRRLL